MIGICSSLVLAAVLALVNAQPDCGANTLEFLCSFTDGCRWKNGKCESDGSWEPPATDPPTPQPDDGNTPQPTPAARTDVCRQQDNLPDFCGAFNVAADLDCTWFPEDNTCRSLSFNEGPSPSPSPSADDPCQSLTEDNCESFNTEQCWKCDWSKSKDKCRWDGDLEKDMAKLEKYGCVNTNEDPCSTITEGSCQAQGKKNCWNCVINDDGDACEWDPKADMKDDLKKLADKGCDAADDMDPCLQITEGSCSQYNEERCWKCDYNKKEGVCEWDGDFKDDLKKIEKKGCYPDPCRAFDKDSCELYNESKCFECKYDKKDGCEWKGNHKKDLKKLAKKGCKASTAFPDDDPCRQFDDQKDMCDSNNDQFCWKCDYDKKKDRCEWDGNYKKDQEKLVKKGCKATSNAECEALNDDPVACVRRVGCAYDKDRNKNERCFSVPVVVPQRRK